MMIPLRRSFGLLTVLLLLLHFKTGEGSKTLFVVLDGFRYDYVKLFETPHLENITNQPNTLFHPGVLPIFPVTTLPNLASMITGNFSDTHGVTYNNPVKSGGKNISPSSREYWRQLREMGTIWNSYVAASSSKSNKTPPGLIGWPFSVEMDAPKNQSFIHIKKSKKFSTKLAQIKQLFYNQSLDFVSVYIDEPGGYAIPYGPRSKQVNESIARLDAWIGDLVKEFSHDTNIIITSTPGYLNASLSDVIYLNKILEDGTYTIHGNSPFLSIVPKEGEAISIFETLDRQKNFKTYHKNKIPKEWHYQLESHVKIILLASEGKVFGDFFNTVKRFQNKNGIKEPLERVYGLNGYVDDIKKSRSILLGIGPAFTKSDDDSIAASLERTEARSIDIYPLLCHLLNLDIPTDREGKLDPFVHDLSNPPIETIEKIKKVFKRISNTPAASAIGLGALFVFTILACIIIIYRRKSKKLDHSYSYTQIRDNRRGDALEEEFEKVEFLGAEEEFHEAVEERPPEDEKSLINC